MSNPMHKNPLKAPWPPGQNWRVIDGGPLGVLFQLKPGAATPANLYLQLARQATTRAFRYGKAPCLN